MNTTTPGERSEKDGLAREPRELSSEELESIIGGSEVGIGIGRSGMEEFYGNIPMKSYTGTVAIPIAIPMLSGDIELLSYTGTVSL